MHFDDDEHSYGDDDDWLTMFDDEEKVIIDKGHLSERNGAVICYISDGYFNVLVNGEETEVHVFRLTKN